MNGKYCWAAEANLPNDDSLRRPGSPVRTEPLAGPIAIVAHVACGPRWVLLQRDISPATTNRIAWAFITVGVVAFRLILLALLNVHIA
jgi:hypothetical protein